MSCQSHMATPTTVSKLPDVPLLDTAWLSVHSFDATVTVDDVVDFCEETHPLRANGAVTLTF